MSRAALLTALIALAPGLPPACAKLLGKGEAGTTGETIQAPSGATVDAGSASTNATATGAPTPAFTTPPIYTAPESTPPATVVDAGLTDYDRAKDAIGAKDYKKVRALLEKRVRAGKANPEEAKLLWQACSGMRDKACIDFVKTKYPLALQP